MTTVCAHQPDFAPWLGFFDRLLDADILVILDNVQFLRRGWHHRDKIKEGGEARWLTLPVLKSGRYDQRIDEVELEPGGDWRRKHLRSLEHAYGRAPHFQTVMPMVRALYERPGNRMIDLNLAFLHLAFDCLDIRVETRLASALGGEGKSNALLIDLTRKVGGDTYLTGTGARDYLDEAAFAAAGIQVAWQAFDHPVYPQQGDGFVPGLSVLDALFNLGGEGTRRVLERNRGDV